MKYWLVPQQVLVPLVMHRLVPEEQDPPQSVHAIAPMSLYLPGEHMVHAATDAPK